MSSEDPPMDREFEERSPDESETASDHPPETDARSGAFWRRILYMIGYGFVGYFVLLALYAVAVVQALYTLVSGRRSPEIAGLAHNLNHYLTEIMGFVSWTRDDKPFPAKPFPDNAQ